MTALEYSLEQWAGWKIEIINYKKIQQQYETVKGIIEKSEVYNELKSEECYIEEDTENGWFILFVENHKADEMIKLSKDIITHLDKTHSNIKVIIRIHVDIGNVETDRNGKGHVKGIVLDILTEMTGFGSNKHILLTNEAINTITAITNNYRNNFHRAGNYSIKYMHTLNIWYYYDGVIGNDRRPKRRRTSLIKYLSRKNKPIIITLILSICISFIISGVLFLNQISLSNKTDILKDQLLTEIDNITTYHMTEKQAIEKIAQSRLDTLNLSRDPKLDDILNNTIKLSLNRELENIVKDPRSKAQYSWIARTGDENCTIAFYKPYDNRFKNTSNSLSYPWCIGMNNYDVYLTPSYYATGPKNFVNTLVSKITVKSPDDKSHVVGYFGEAFDWNKIFPPLMKFVNRDTATLVDYTGLLAAECKFDKCTNLGSNIPPSDNLHPEPIHFKPDFISNYFSQDLIDNFPDLPSNYHIVNNWKLSLISDAERLDIEIHLLLSLIIGIVVVIIIYYYIIPRYWLEDITT